MTNKENSAVTPEELKEKFRALIKSHEGIHDGVYYISTDAAAQSCAEFASLVSAEKDKALEDVTIDCEFQAEMREKAELALKESGLLCKQYREEKESIQAHRNDLSEELTKLREENERQKKVIEQVNWQELEDYNALEVKADKLVEALEKIAHDTDIDTFESCMLVAATALTAYQSVKEQEGETK